VTFRLIFADPELFLEEEGPLESSLIAAALPRS
jgi:hypothetical protein